MENKGLRARLRKALSVTCCNKKNKISTDNEKSPKMNELPEDDISVATGGSGGMHPGFGKNNSL